ncbi:MAG: hypothetical protein ABUS48_04515 [Pseudomonadota bacterium]
MTIGKLYHDEHIVFGPALNRAYELEHREAVYPRALLDPEIESLASLTSDFIARDDKYAFTDPFNLAFITRMNDRPPNAELIASFNAATGLELPTEHIRHDPRTILAAVLLRVEQELQTNSDTNVVKKHLWLRERIAAALFAHKKE